MKLHTTQHWNTILSYPLISNFNIYWYHELKIKQKTTKIWVYKVDNNAYIANFVRLWKTRITNGNHHWPISVCVMPAVRRTCIAKTKYIAKMQIQNCIVILVLVNKITNNPVKKYVKQHRKYWLIILKTRFFSGARLEKIRFSELTLLSVSCWRTNQLILTNRSVYDKSNT